MLTIEVLGSGSDANGYILKPNDDEYLLIECGVRPSEMLKAIGFQTCKIAGCVISHSHGDHARYVKAYGKYGFPIYASEFVSDDILQDYQVRTRRMKRNAEQCIGNFTVVPFRVPHNETECDGFLIKHHEFSNLLFITDAEMCPWNFSTQAIKHILVECNYSDVFIDVDAPNKTHVLKGHMELQTCKRFIKSCGDSLESIGLIHISNGNANPYWFKADIEENFPERFVWIAEKGKTIILTEENDLGRH